MTYQILLKVNKENFDIEVQNVEGPKKEEIQELFKYYFEHAESKGYGAGTNNDYMCFCASCENFNYHDILEELENILYLS